MKCGSCGGDVIQLSTGSVCLLCGSNKQYEYLPEKFELDKMSVVNSANKSLNKQSLSKEWLDIVIKDSGLMYNSVFQCEFIFKYVWRVKSAESIFRKYDKGLTSSLRVNSVFNDMIGIRIRVPEYKENYPEYLRTVDMRGGKKVYDGYKAIHLYYQKSNYHYQIEIQLWSEIDYNFNEWSHTYAYKTTDVGTLVKLRELYDKGSITSEVEFKEALRYEER